MLVWYVVIMLMVVVYVVYVVLMSVSVLLSLLLVCGVSFGSVYGFIVWYVFDIIVGVGESGIGL